MSTTEQTAGTSPVTGPTDARLETVRMYRVYIKASAQAVWDAIVDPAWTVRYGYEAPVEYDLRPGGTFRGLPSDVMKEMGASGPVVDGEVIQADPPRLLVQTWRTLWDDEARAEGFTRLTYEIEDDGAGVCRLTVLHDVTDAPRTRALVDGELGEFGGGWSQTLSDLKSLLETGSSLY